MKFKKMPGGITVPAVLCAAAIVCMILTAVFSEIWIAVIELIIFAAFAVFTATNFDLINIYRRKAFRSASGFEEFNGEMYSHDFPLPVVVCSMDGEVVWFNSPFEENVIGASSSNLAELKAMLKHVGMESVINSAGHSLVFDGDGASYNIYSNKAKNNGSDVVVMYLVDNTKYRQIADEFVKTRPAIVIVTIDNMSELQQDYKESDCAAIRNGIEKLVETWVKDYRCFMTKVSDSKFCIVTEKRHIDNMAEEKYNILDAVRSFTYDGKYVGATVSVGVGTGLNYAQCESNAKLSVDMALGRGGDQAAVKTKEGYEFFGGISKSVENTSKVKSRVVASALAELIEGSDSVFIMGHRFPDFDAMGSAFGVACISKSLGKDAFVITSVSDSMAKPLISAAAENGFGDAVITHDEAKTKLSQGKKNLLVIVDTHIKNFVEFPDLLDLANMVVIVDHHRKAVDYIENSVIFFHDPSASSASEMVTELAEYIPATTHLGSFTADALMAGIMLDTKNFILRATSRTFEAAAFLKGQGAETVRVKKLFANDIESQQCRNTIISAAKKYRNCAIAVADVKSDDIRMVCAQAADELLNISGVDASFVVFENNGAVCVSARSLGAINVQIIMEYMKGGGHQTMAAVQLKDTTVEKTVEELMHNIDKYNENIKED